MFESGLRTIPYANRVAQEMCIRDRYTSMLTQAMDYDRILAGSRSHQTGVNGCLLSTSRNLSGLRPVNSLPVRWTGSLTLWRASVSVSYTHLDVYKRQVFLCAPA